MPLDHTSSIPPVGLGTFRLKEEAARKSIRDAISLGYRHIDTAAIYQNEQDIGLVLQELYNEHSSTLTRSDIWITSKLSPYDMKSPRASLLRSMASLKTEYLDLYLIHWPAVARKAAASPENKRLRIEAWNVLNEAKREGLVCNIGVSNFTPQHIQELIDETKHGIQGAFVQMEIHPWYWRDASDIQTKFAQHGVIIVGYALLAEGKLLPEGSSRVLQNIAARLGITRVQLVLAWALNRHWFVLAKSEDTDHLRQNLEAPLVMSKLTSEDCTAIDSISSSHNEEKRCWDPRVVK